MGGGSSKSPPKPDTSPKVYQNNEGVPDEPERRGLPIRERSPQSQSLLAPKRDEHKDGMLY